MKRSILVLLFTLAATWMTAAMAATPVLAACQQWTASNSAHVSAGRAYTQETGSGCNSTTTYYANGSNESMGTFAYTSNTLSTSDNGQTYHVGGCPTGTDADGDGYPSTNDCNDANAAIHPGATEVCGDGIDQDCSGVDLSCTATCQQYSATNDAHVSAGRAYTQSTGSGCNTTATYYAKGSNENLGTSGSTTVSLYSTDGGTTYRRGSCPTPTDADGDGYPSTSDCNDSNASIHPGAAEVCGDGIDQDCSGADLPCGTTDADGDGYPSTSDCNDANAAIHPGATEVCGDGIDQDCSGADLPCGTTDADGDGYPSTSDCRDNDKFTHPGAFDFCGDGLDQDCSGADEACLGAPSCIASAGNWKIKYAPANSNCISCHTSCTPGGSSGRHSCTEGASWGSMSCTGCHRSVH
jgi:hypothetical protein